MAILEVEGLSKSYGAFTLEALNFSMVKGEILSLMGESGCGKTTLLRLLAGFEWPDEGKVSMQNRVLLGPNQFTPPENRKIGMVFQDYALFPHLTVAQNLRFGLRGNPRTTKRKRVSELLELVGLTGYENRYPHELSGGEQQRIAIGRALAPEPMLLLLDEPFSNLDALVKAAVRAEVARIIRQSQCTAILVTHDVEDALDLSDRILILRKGVMHQWASPAEVQAAPATPYVQQLLASTGGNPALPRGSELIRTTNTSAGTELTFRVPKNPAS